jgi:hypothetical protein
MDDYIKQVQELFGKYVPKNEKIQTTYGIEWKIKALSGDWMFMNGAEYSDLQIVTNITDSMKNEHVDVRIVKFTKEVKREILDV